MTIIEHLIKQKIIDKQKGGSLEYEAKVSGRTVEEIIVEKGISPEKSLFEFKSANLGIPLKEVPPEDVPLKVLELIPYDSAGYYKMIPLDKKEDWLEVGMVYPEDFKAQEA